MELKGSQTEKNLLTAFAGESQARNRYTYFASKASKEGFRQISEIFTETANQEKEHAERLFKLLEGGEVEISAAFPAGVIGTTLENLKAGAAGENHGLRFRQHVNRSGRPVAGPVRAKTHARDSLDTFRRQHASRALRVRRIGEENPFPVPRG